MRTTLSRTGAKSSSCRVRVLNRRIGGGGSDVRGQRVAVDEHFERAVHAPDDQRNAGAGGGVLDMAADETLDILSERARRVLAAAGLARRMDGELARGLGKAGVGRQRDVEFE